MDSANLTSGSIAAISEGEGDDLQPVLQVVEIRLVNTVKSSVERYRMLLSDGVHHQQGMLATQMNEIVKSGQLQKGSIVQLTEFFCNTIQGRRIIIAMSLQVLAEKSEVIGEPRSYDGCAAIPQKCAPGPLQPPMNQNDLSIETAQPHSDSRPGGSFAGQNVGVSLPKKESALNNQPYGSSITGGSFSGSINNVSSLQPRAQSGSGNIMDRNQNVCAQPQRFLASTTAGSSSPGNAYGRPALPTYQQPPPMYTNRGPIAKNEAPVRIIPISALNPYQGKWTIKARVTAKGELRHYNNARGEGKVFSFDLLDCDGGEIRATCFNLVADQFYDQIEIGKIYLVSKGSLRPTQKSFNHLNNEYEIMLESSSTIQSCSEDDTIPRQQFTFRPISEIESIDNNSTVDVIGIVSSIHPAGTIMRKNGTETHKRTLQLKDMSGKSVEITLWGNFCNAEGHEIQGMCDSGIFPVLAIKVGRVSDFSGKSVSTISSSQLFINPDIPEMHQLKEWFEREGKNHSALSISRETAVAGRIGIRKTVSQIKDEGLGRSEKPDWITMKATVSFIKLDNFCYTACPLMVGDRQCNKKVNNNGDGTWHCDRCDKSFPDCDYRYLLQFQIQDHSGISWVTAFQECAEEILGISAKELYLLKYEEQDELKFAEIVRRVLFNQYLFKLKVKEETFSDEQRVKSTTIKAERVDPSSESRYLLGMIEKLSIEDATIFPSIINVECHPNGQNIRNMPIAGSGLDRFKLDPSSRVGLGQHLNQYGGGTRDNSMWSRENPSVCKNCGLPGHSIQNCPRSLNRQEQAIGVGFSNRASVAVMDGGNASNVCFKCQQPGHWARDCPGVSSISSGYGGRNFSSSVGASNVSSETYGRKYLGNF